MVQNAFEAKINDNTFFQKLDSKMQIHKNNQWRFTYFPKIGETINMTSSKTPNTIPTCVCEMPLSAAWKKRETFEETAMISHPHQPWVVILWVNDMLLKYQTLLRILLKVSTTILPFTSTFTTTKHYWRFTHLLRIERSNAWKGHGAAQVSHGEHDHLNERSINNFCDWSKINQ